MKLASLLVQYLYNHKRLDLAGIGSFILNQPDFSETEYNKSEKKTGPGDVSFESNAAVKQNPDLVQFIAEQTGKIKALASADLESHLSLARQFLNIGNPFLFEGIGILEKNKSGKYVLKQLGSMPEKSKEFLTPENEDPRDTGKSSHDFKKILYYDKIKTKWRKTFAAILIIAGLALAVWGGYMVYKKKSAKNNAATVIKKDESAQNDYTTIDQKDSAVSHEQNIPAGTKKFILEVSNTKRAFERYGRLKAFEWDVQMETKDSITYKLFLVLPASVNDTSRIIDSLSLLSGRRVYVEK